MNEYAKLRRVAELGDLEVLSARFVHHEYARHTHEQYAFCLYDAGQADFECRGETHRVRSGGIAAINPDEVHNGRAGGSEGYSYRVIYPSQGLLRQVSESLHGQARALPFFATIINDADLTAAFKRLHETIENPTSRLERESHLWHALGLLIFRCGDDLPVTDKTLGREARAVGIARAYIQAHLSENTSLHTLSELTGLGVYHLVRVFGRSIGLPPHAYQTVMRVRLARGLLLKGLDSATVALEAGFSDQNHLTRHFKRVYGVTPGQFARA